MLRAIRVSRFSLFAVFAARVAFASEVYPPEIKSELGLSKAPDCTLCHRTDNGGKSTAVKPFARSMQSLGLVGNSNLPSLRTALGKAETQETDSDGDGVSDVDELRAGEDPNHFDAREGGVTAPVVEALPPALETGCALTEHPRSTHAPSGGVGFVTAAVCFLWCRSRRRAGARRHKEFSRVR